MDYGNYEYGLTPLGSLGSLTPRSTTQVSSTPWSPGTSTSGSATYVGSFGISIPKSCAYVPDVDGTLISQGQGQGSKVGLANVGSPYKNGVSTFECIA